MFGCIQTILNELRSLGKTYDDYDHTDKILRSLSRKSRPQVMQSYPSRALNRRLQEDSARDVGEGPRVLMSFRVDFGFMS